MAALFEDTRPKKNQDKDKANEEKPPNGVTFDIEGFCPPSFEILEKVHFLIPLEYGAALKPCGKGGPAHFP